ncbi:MAG: type 2 lanthipeptide synthetase LanM family protein [Dokdonella sp.]
MTSAANVDDFTPSLGCLLATSVDKLAVQLGSISELHPRERAVILAKTRESLHAFLHAKLTRLLLLELNAARVTQRLKGADASRRWREFIDLSSQREFWDELGEHYPSLQQRIDCAVSNRCDASLLLAQRWANDRTSLEPLCGRPAGELQDLSFGAGDSHLGGLTVALVRCEGGRIVYKPRSMAVDSVLQDFISGLEQDHGSPLGIRVPRVVEGQDHGWAEFVEHRYASGDAELREFYRGIGYWLAIMHLLGASDLHAENLIANGVQPVVVDCETLFTPRIPLPASGYGKALDRASELVAGTVLNIGLLPGRAQTLGWRGIDYSGMGSLPGQQPMLPLPTILNAGTDEAYLGTTLAAVPVAQNHPSPLPALAQFWPDALTAFDQMTATLRRLDASGILQQRLQAFADCRIRVVLRATEAYAEIGRMLWHPVSLHNDAQARQRAYDLLARMAVNVISAPSDPAVMNAEIDDLLVGDIPFFSTLVHRGQLDGPRGTLWLEPDNLAESALRRWRASDAAFERNVIRAAMVSAYLNDRWTSHLGSHSPHVVRTDNLESRRRTQAASIMRGLVDNAILETDQSVSWIAPVLNPAGWAVQPLAMDLYGGLSGVALLAGGYLREAQAGRADEVAGVDTLFIALQQSLRLAEFKKQGSKVNDAKLRPPPLGAYIGLGSQIWTLMVLAHWNKGRGDEVQRARVLAEDIVGSAAADDMNDLLTGIAGAIPPLLALAKATQEERFLHLATELGNQLCERAKRKGPQAFWVHEQRWPQGIGGYSHGVTGVGWALVKLARATGFAHFHEMAEAAFAFEDSLYDDDEQNWIDLRDLGGPKSAAVWCHGSAGIGLAHLDLDPQFLAPRTRQLVRRAAAVTWQTGMGWNHCLCHGDMSAWELLDKAIVLGEAPQGLTREALLAQIVTSIEDNGPSCGLTREVFVPGLLPGLGGVAYQLLRAHPASDLPSVLTLGCEGF